MIIAKEYTIVCDKCGYTHEYRYLYRKKNKERSLNDILSVAKIEFKYCKEFDKILCNNCYREFKQYCADFFQEKAKYKEIKELYDFCVENGVNCEFEPFLDGYVILFAKGDVVQHRGSYGYGCGKVEFGFTGYKEVDLVACSLEKAKEFILEHKDELSVKKVEVEE